MILASCNFWTQAYTCFDSSQYLHVLRKRKGREAVAGVPSLPVAASQQLRQTGTQTKLGPASNDGRRWPGGTVKMQDGQSTAEP